MAGRADGHPVILREVTGDQRTIELFNHDLPQQGIEHGGSTNLVTTRYPGSSRASVQVLSTGDLPITLTGVLRDLWTGLDGGALAQRDAMESFRRRQALLELQWGDVLNVRGFIQEGRFRLFREDHIEYDITFEVTESSEADVIAPQWSAPTVSYDLEQALAELDTSAEEPQVINGLVARLLAVL